MVSALTKISALPDNTRVYFGHEYSVSNLKFAKDMEPNNVHVQEKLQWAQTQRSQNYLTVPSTVAEEKTYNPFMRCESAELKRTLQLSEEANSITVMAAVRQAKNEWKPSS